MKYSLDESYSSRSGGNKGLIIWIIVIFVLVVILSIVGYLYYQGKREIVSPVPAEPSFEVIFQTPTPGEVTPTPENKNDEEEDSDETSPTVRPTSKSTPTSEPANEEESTE